jgi:ZIP family zinc transporter
VVAVEIMPRVLENLSAWVIALAFALGGIAYVGIEKLVESLQKRQGQQGEGGQTSVWMIYIAVSIDLFSDGLLIGAGSAVSPSVAIILAAGQVLADVPEGFATIATMKDKGILAASGYCSLLPSRFLCSRQPSLLTSYSGTRRGLS